MAILGTIFTFLAEHPGFIIVGFLLYVFVVAVSFLFSGPRPGEHGHVLIFYKSRSIVFYHDYDDIIN